MYSLNCRVHFCLLRSVSVGFNIWTADATSINQIDGIHTDTARGVVALSIERHPAGSSCVFARSAGDHQLHVYEEFARRRAWNRSACWRSNGRQHIALGRHEGIE